MKPHDLAEILVLRGDPLSEVDILRFEESFSCKLPNDYREFIKLSNGGCPAANLEGHSVEKIYSLSDIVDAHCDYNSQEEMQVPNGLICIIHNGCGDNYCLSVGESTYGKIYFWDHEDLEVDLIADSFTEFVEVLTIKGAFHFPDPSVDPSEWISVCEQRYQREGGAWCLRTRGEANMTASLSKAFRVPPSRILDWGYPSSPLLFHGRLSDLDWVGEELAKFGVLSEIFPDFDNSEVIGKVGKNAHRQYRNLPTLIEKLT